MVKQAIISKDSGNEYELTIHNGKAVGCTCGQRKALEAYNVFTPCKHMKEYNTPKPVQPVVLWSNVCGHRVRFDVDSHCGCMA